MKRMYIDCRESPGSGCTVALSADSEKELLDAAVQHGVAVHGFKDNAETRNMIRKMIKELKTPAAA